MKNQIEKSKELLVDFQNIEKLYQEGFELIKNFEEGKSVANKQLNTIVRELGKYDTIGTKCLSLLIDCESKQTVAIPEVKSNLEHSLISIMNIKHKYNNLNFMIRQDLLKTIINMGHEISRCLKCVDEKNLVDVA
ncbi:MAG: hypothetical protein R2799_13905 [Crocinitomicaceae bacterium]